MPLYEFRCHSCGQHVEVWLRSSSDKATCPQCGGSLRDKLWSAPFVMGGDTLRPPGKTCCGQDERCDTPACSTDGTCRRR